MYNVVKYLINVKDTHWPTSKHHLTKTVQQHLNNQQRIDEFTAIDDHDIRNEEIYCHNAEMLLQTKTVPVHIISPIVTISWLYMLPAWKNLLDFNFQRKADWNGDSPVIRFNDCEYVQKHKIYDWHSFAMLQDETLLYNGVIVQDSDSNIYFIIDILYCIPDKILFAKKASTIRKLKNQSDFKPDTVMVAQHIISHNDRYIIQDTKEEYDIFADSELSVVTSDNILNNIYDTQGVKFQIENRIQHKNVQECKPFFFFTLGFDEYHHTEFTGKHDWDTHGVYWWIANMHPQVQFKQSLTMIMGQIPDAIKLPTVGQIVYQHWSKFIYDGISLWNGNSFEKVHGMVANQITDMEARDHFMRRRGNNAKSASDAMLWPGYKAGCVWPRNVINLMQLGIIMPGPYMLKLWQHLKHDLTGTPGFWTKFNDDITQCICMSKSDEDIYDGIPLDSTLKSTIELNHTTLLGCTSDIAKIEWKRLVMKNNFQEVQLRTMMKYYLHEYFDGINGCESLLGDYKTKITTFNAMHHAWQKLVELSICLPTIVDWFGNMSAMVALIRITGALFTVNTENQIQHLQQIIKPILEAS